MRKRTKISGFKSVMLLIVSVLALVLIFGAVYAAFQSVESDPNNDVGLLPGDDQEPEREEIPVDAFGGEAIFSEDFENPDADLVANKRFTMNGNSYNLRYDKSQITGSFDGALSFTHTGTGGISSELLAIMYLSNGDDQVFYDDIDYLSLDFDISLSEFYDRLLLTTYYIDESGSVTVPGDYNKLYMQNVDGFVNFCIDSDSDGEKEIVKTIPSDSFHLTVIYKHDHINSYYTVGRAYVNGEYLCDIPRSAGSFAARIASFRFAVPAKYNLNNNGTFSIDNIAINIFERDYDGAIGWLFKDTSYSLQECSDSVLFEGEYPEPPEQSGDVTDFE